MDPLSSCKKILYLLVSFISIYLSSAFSQNSQISFSYNKIDLNNAIAQLVDSYQISLIYPGNIEKILVSAECVECPIDEALTKLLFYTEYEWEKIKEQYIIYKPNPESYSIHGKIIENNSNETIPYANVFIPGQNIGTITDNEGFFSIIGINSKVCTLHVSYIGYDTEKKIILLNDKNSTEIQVQLNQKILISNNIFIRGNSREFLDVSKKTGQISFSPKHISSLPTLGEIDISRSLQLIPGIHQGLGGTAELYIRGGRPDQNMVILDGMPLFQNTHMFGFYSGTQAKAIKDIQVFKGGFPVKYGGKTAGLIEMTSRIGNTLNPHLRLFSNFTINSAQIEVPFLSRGSIIVTGRKSNDLGASKLYHSIQDFVTGDDRFNLISLAANENQKATYSPEFSFNDMTAVASFLITPKHKVSITYTEGEDIIIENREFLGFQTLLGNDSTSINEDTEKSNKGGVLNWSYYWNADWKTKISLSNSEYYSKYYSKQYNGINNDPLLLAQTSNEQNKFFNETYNLNHTIHSIKNHNIELGVNKSIFISNYDIKRLFEGDTETLKSYQNYFTNSYYFEDTWNLTNSIKLKGGIRNTYYSFTKNNYIAPRVSGSYKITSNITIEMSLGKYNQFAHQFNSPLGTRGTHQTWLLSNKNIPVTNSLNSYNSVFYKNNNYELNISNYNRKNKNQFDFENFISPFPLLANQYNDNISIGSEKTSGLEVLIRRKNNKINGWISYQYNNTKYSFDDIDKGKYFLADHNLSHEFKSVLITSILDYSFTATWSYSSGRVYTDLNNIYIDKTNDYKIVFSPETRNRQKLNPVHHLDISILKELNLKWFDLEAGISIYNVYNRKNISHKRYNPYSEGNIISNVVMLGITPTFFIQLKI